MMRPRMALEQRGWIIGVAIGCSLLVHLAPSVCSAAPPAEEPPTTGSNPPQAARRWYGWQTFAADGVAGTVFLAAVADDHNTTLFALSGLSFGLGAPVIHLSHGNWQVALGSLGLRVAGPFVGALIGSQSDIRVSEDATSTDRSSKWGVAGAAIGGLVASAIDGLLLSYDTRVSSPAPPHNQLLRADSFPQLVVLRQGVGLEYSGQF
ncbi:MAG: hypothetical protein WDO74_29900 [Pseudomonadota bacterium]